MLRLEIPGRGLFEFEYLVLDFNGTIALDGQIIPGVETVLRQLAEKLQIYVLTADTFGTAKAQCAELPVTLQTLTSGDHTQEKGNFVTRLGSQKVISIGNGYNDQMMILNAALGIGVINDEGCAGPILRSADLIILGIVPALQLLVQQKRLIATLRG